MVMNLLRCCGCQAGSEEECKANKKTCCNKTMDLRCVRGWIPIPTENKVKQVLTKKKDLITAWKKLEAVKHPKEDL